jgi:hypothetical protein
LDTFLLKVSRNSKSSTPPPHPSENTLQLLSFVHLPQNAMRVLGLCAIALSVLGFHPVAAAQGIDVLSANAELTIPKTALPALLRASPQSMTVVINGNAEILAPGAQIRDAKRHIVFPALLHHLIGSDEVKAAIERDFNGQLIRIWILPATER